MLKLSHNQTVTYSPTGNITSKSDQGTYTYAQPNYTNPHAVTSINGTTHTYDNVGNTTAIGTNTWDYRNRLTSSITSGTTNNYTYNHNNIRIQKGNTTATTTYPNKYYNTQGATTTKHIFSTNGTLLATVSNQAITVIPINVYEDTLSTEFSDWSWSTTRDFSSTQQVYEGTNSLKTVYTSPWGGLYLHGDNPTDVSNYDQLSFAFHGDTTGGQNISVRVTDAQNNELTPVDMQ